MNRQLLVLLGVVLVVSPVAAQGDAKATKGTVRARDGLNIAYNVRGKGDTALVFLHGWCCDRESWKHQVDDFAKDYRVVTIDVGGHGESGKDRKEWTIKGLAGDVEAVVKELGLKRVILIGHSMGGTVGLEVAKRMPGVVVAVIGVDTLHNAEHEWPKEQMKQFLDGFLADFKGTMANAMRSMLHEKSDPELREWITKKAQSQDPKMALAIFGDFPNQDMKAMFKDAKVPIRCINALPYSQFAIPTAPDINKKYADFNVVTMEGVGHFPMLEKPAEFNEKLRTTLKEFGTKK